MLTRQDPATILSASGGAAWANHAAASRATETLVSDLVAVAPEQRPRQRRRRCGAGA